MRYDDLIQTISEIVNNDLINKNGLGLIYSLDEENHKNLSEHFFYKLNGDNNNIFEYTEEFEVEIGNMIIKFVINEK